MVAIPNTIGLILNAAGVLLLFYFGMPFRVRTEGKTARTFVLPDQSELVRAERRYDNLGTLGLFLILVGTAFQVYSNWID